MFYETAKGHPFPVDPYNALVVPRPIGWISTISRDGRCNLAPFSYFNAVAADPYYVAFNSGTHRHGGKKGTLLNIEETGEFVHSLATEELREAMNITSAHLPHGDDEFERAGLAKAPSLLVKPPRVAASPVTFECRLHQIVPLPDDTGSVGDHLVIGRVMGIHISDRYIADGRIDTAAMRPLARLGYSEYATISEAWRMRRPD